MAARLSKVQFHLHDQFTQANYQNPEKFRQRRIFYIF